MVDDFLAWVSALPQAGVYAVLIALSAVENVFPPVPADVALVLGAFLSQRGHGPAYALGTMCWAANVISSAGMYFYARSQGNPQAWLLGLIVAIAMTGSCVISGLSGALIPMTLKRLGADPATASSIFLTTATDVASMGIFLSLATALIR